MGTGLKTDRLQTTESPDSTYVFRVKTHLTERDTRGNQGVNVA